MRRDVGLRAQPIGNAPALNFWNHRLHVRIIKTENGGAVKGNLVHKVGEAAPHVFHVVVVIHMLAIDVRDHGNHRRQHQKGSIAFISFDHHQFAFPQTSIGAIGAHDAAHYKSRIKAGRAQHRRDHRGRRRLTMGTRTGDRVRLHPHQLRQHFCARNHRNRSPTRFDNLGIIIAHRGRANHDMRVANIFRRVSFSYFHSQLFKMRRDFRLFLIRA